MSGCQWVEGDDYSLNGYEISFWGDESALELVVMVAQCCECFKCQKLYTLAQLMVNFISYYMNSASINKEKRNKELSKDFQNPRAK